MKFVCLGYLDEERWDAMSEGDRAEFLDGGRAYGAELVRGGHVVAGAALRRDHPGVILRSHDGRVEVTDGPFAETKEVLGGLVIFEARDLNHAIQLMSPHPRLRGGRFEIFAVDEPAGAPATATATAPAAATRA